jgi:hypothetical protein
VLEVHMQAGLRTQGQQYQWHSRGEVTRLQGLLATCPCQALSFHNTQSLIPILSGHEMQSTAIRTVSAYHGYDVGMQEASMYGHLALHLVSIERRHSRFEVQLQSYAAPCLTVNCLVHYGGRSHTQLLVQYEIMQTPPLIPGRG